MHAPRNLKVRVYDPTGYSSMSRMTSSSIATIVVILQSIFGGIFRGTGRQRMGSIVHATGYGVGLIIGVPLLFCTELSLAGDNTHRLYGAYRPGAIHKTTIPIPFLCGLITATHLTIGYP